jgi:hypothetical protein
LAVKAVRRYPVAVLAALLVLGGAGATARTLITGADIEDGTLRSEDVRDGSLRRADFSPGARLRGLPGRRGPAGPPGPPGPPGPSRVRDVPMAYASVAADGAVQTGSAGVTVSHVAPGVYCASVPGARWVQVAAEDADMVAAAVPASSPCPAAAPIRVSVAGPYGALEDGAFHLLARNG